MLLFGLREYDPPGQGLAFTRLYVRNSFTGQFLTEPYLDAWKVSGVHLFCAGHAILPDGKVLIAGGTIGTDIGITDTYLFDPVSLTISHAGWLSQARYYPSLVTLQNGNVAAVSGWQSDGNWSQLVEIRDTATGAWTAFDPVNSGSLQPHYYPFLFSMYNEDNASQPRVFMAGKSLTSPSDMRTTTLTMFSATSGRWDLFGGTSTPVQGSEAVILIARTAPTLETPLVPDDKGVVYKFGGSLGSSGVTNEVRVIDLNEAEAEWAPAPSMQTPRANCNAVILPTGDIAIVAGSSEQHLLQTYGSRIPTVEIYRPGVGPVAITPPDMARSRMYHSTAILLPDGSVLIPGGQYKELVNGQWVSRSEFSGQIYYPPYFQEPSMRPTISGTSSLTMPYGPTNTFTVYTDQANAIEKVTMIRLSATTHNADMNERFINLSIKDRTANSIEVHPPVHPSVAPPGDYMLFIVTTQGVPSVAQYVKLQ